MNDYIISCCSTADLPKEYFESRQIQYICFHYYLDGEAYPDDLGQTIPFKEFYDKMRNGSDTKTSQVNVEEYCEYFDKFLSAGKDIIHICLSSGISGTYNSACIAKDMMEEKYPNRKIYVIDSLSASAGFGLLADKMADLRDSGMSIEDLYEWTVVNRMKVNHWVFSTDLTFYVKGGRISKTAGFMGGVLNICPIIEVNFEGKLIPRTKVRTKKKTYAFIVDKMKELADGGIDYDQKCFISHSDCIEDAQAIAQLIEENFPNMKGKIMISDVGTTIGSHTGPGTVATCFFGKVRVD